MMGQQSQLVVLLLARGQLKNKEKLLLALSLLRSCPIWVPGPGSVCSKYLSARSVRVMGKSIGLRLSPGMEKDNPSLASKK